MVKEYLLKQKCDIKNKKHVLKKGGYGGGNHGGGGRHGMGREYGGKS